MSNSFWIFNFFNYGIFVVNFFILNGSQNMKHLFSIQNACCKQNLYIVYVMYHIYAQIFFCDGRYCDRKNVMDFNFGKISIENLCIELKYKGDNVLGWGLFKDTTFDSGRPFYCIHHKYFWTFVTSRKSKSVLFFLQHV